MRIIGGKLGGTRIHAPRNLPVRPTTDLSKEALFNILSNKLDFEQLSLLDLFSGTGNISLEFASRGAVSVQAVDASYSCVKFLIETAMDLGLTGIKVIKADVFKFIQRQEVPPVFDVIFADPPFDHPKLNSLPGVIFEKGLLKDSDSLFIMEHPSTISFDHLPQLTETRKYGYSSFSFFRMR